MAFGTWFKNLLVKGKNFIKKASPYIRKGIEIARKVGPMIGGTVGSVINGIANGADMFLDRIAPNRLRSDSVEDSRNNSTISKPRQPIQALTFDVNDFTNLSKIDDVNDNKIEMIQKPILGGNKGRLNPILK